MSSLHIHTHSIFSSLTDKCRVTSIVCDSGKKWDTCRGTIVVQSLHISTPKEIKKRRKNKKIKKENKVIYSHKRNEQNVSETLLCVATSLLVALVNVMVVILVRTLINENQMMLNRLVSDMSSATHMVAPAVS